MADYVKQKVKCQDCGINWTTVRRNKSGKFKRCESCDRKIDLINSRLKRKSNQLQQLRGGE